MAFAFVATVEAGLAGFATLDDLPGVQLLTLTSNVPPNNRPQSLDLDAADETTRSAARRAFEGRWKCWDPVRTVVPCLVSVLLIGLSLRIQLQSPQR